MNLTDKVKAYIDSLSYFGLLGKWRFTPAGDPMFQGESGQYFAKRLSEMREKVGDDEHVATSKALGWEK